MVRGRTFHGSIKMYFCVLFYQSQLISELFCLFYVNTPQLLPADCSVVVLQKAFVRGN